MDRRKYIAELVEKTGIRIDEDDPAFVLVLLNRLILQDQKTELEALVGQLVKVGGAVRGEVIKQVEEQCNATLRQLQVEAATLKTDLQREHAGYREATKEALRQEIGGTIANAASTMQDVRRLMWTIGITSGVVGGVIVALVAYLLR
ncbi:MULTISPECIES: hypothetical protein [Pseudomonadota]|uniref:hypothetical protein n=1 Tax=Pseudomonadota TaxID=1224 RepID=UPI0020A0A2DA|nr:MULTISPECIES: hypothetical protein [Pseudomonadota]MCP1608222.1 hypothetical protein [Pseudomonas citronellolis]MCP1638244.1 hypothetical protein [Kerstersia gyiorum]MCP1658945.1 hypothetical protein [Pseudomonas citronellolis]MCP1672838.1 hypothetical protein [Kerstersia gyiorum]MCP1710754.1 hypothetical protein [Kerstersia gyiorum]